MTEECDKAEKCDKVNVGVISKKHLMSDIDNEISAGEYRISDLKEKIVNIRMSVEYELGEIRAYKHIKDLLEKQ